MGDTDNAERWEVVGETGSGNAVPPLGGLGQREPRLLVSFPLDFQWQFPGVGLREVGVAADGADLARGVTGEALDAHEAGCGAGSGGLRRTSWSLSMVRGFSLRNTWMGFQGWARVSARVRHDLMTPERMRDTVLWWTWTRWQLWSGGTGPGHGVGGCGRRGPGWTGAGSPWRCGRRRSVGRG